MKPILFREAISDEYVAGAQLVLETLHAFGIYLFGFGQAEYAKNALEKFFRMRGNRFSYQYAEFALCGDEIMGIVMTFDQKEMLRSLAATALQIWQVYRLSKIPEFIKRGMPYSEEEKIGHDELYIAHLAVDKKFRRQGIGFQLLEHAEEKARRKGLTKLSLLTEIENTAARNLYTKFGFRLVDTILFPEKMPYVGSAGDVRMIKILT